MTTEKRQEQRRNQDAIDFAKYTLDRKNYIATIEAQESRISALESLLAISGDKLTGCLYHVPFDEELFQSSTDVVNEIDAILPATEDKK